ncbi:MAG: sigma-70 family RNA polymerase sigma factor [Ignavibacteria bacterium]|nr:sigma-70 family RNA polymerase sigma factor [Ignavibacteria bacterium]
MPSAPHRTYQAVDHLFRHESGRIISVLSRIIGIERLDLVEDAVQESLLKALKIWPYSGVPANPEGWIMQVARNQVIDRLRKERTRQLKRGMLQEQTRPDWNGVTEQGAADIENDQLRMMFACCHPSIPPESQTALILKTLCGFGTAEIARAFLSSQETINKRLVRAKRRLRETYSPDQIVEGGVGSDRLHPVLSALYLLFNEGYSASSGPAHIRHELCDEAMRLVSILVKHRAGNRPETHGLRALMLFHGARLGSRTDSDGHLLLLKEQDRQSWDGGMIAAGFEALERSGEGTEITRYQIEAGIAACHCSAPTYESTDWKRILFLYDLLLQINPSPVIQLNRAIAVFHVNGLEAGLEVVANIRKEAKLEEYYLLHAVLGEFYSLAGRNKDAAVSYRRAMELTMVETERALLSRRLRALLN